MLTLEKNSDKPVIIWLFTGCLLIFSMVVIGGITRLTDSGLSIVEWDLFMGAIPPLNEQDWLLMFTKYQQYPQYKELFSHFSLAEFKSIFWWEYVHRFVGRLIGLVFIIPFIYFLIKKKLSGSLIKKLLLVLLLGGFQGFLGWYMVKSGLVKEPRVSHYRLAAHLITAFLTFAVTFWIALDLIFKGKSEDRGSTVFPALKKLSWTLLIILTLQILYGAFVAGLKAGTVHTTFPLMDGQWMADAVSDYNPVFMGFLESKSGVQFVHRYMAYAVLLLTGLIWWKGRKLPSGTVLKTGIHLLMAAVILQFLLGVFTLLYAVPISLGILHQAGAFLLLGALLFVIHRQKTGILK